MTIEETIQKAIDGGYTVGWFKPSSVKSVEDGEITYLSSDFLPVKEKLAKVLISPLFWQSLGKAMGWWGTNSNGKEQWVNKWHRFIDHLAEGKDAESFFSNLSH